MLARVDLKHNINTKKMKLRKHIDRVENITRQEFEENYLNPQVPVVIKNFFGSEAPLYHKWSYDYFIENIGDVEIGVYDDESTQRRDDRSYKSADNKMLFGEYLQLIQEKPTTKRIFLFNIFKHMPQLKEDYQFPKITGKYLKKLPFVFFGGKGAVTRIHQDMDFSNVFLTELTGKKRVVLFHPKYSKHLYRYPFGVHSSVDPLSPDFNKYPAMEYAEGLDITLEKGETLFMPSGYWHHIVYEESSFGIAIRSLSPRWSQRLRGALNLGVLTHVDELMRYALGYRWFEMKRKIAEKRGWKIVERSGGNSLKNRNARTYS